MIVMGDARKEILNRLRLASPLPQPWSVPDVEGKMEKRLLAWAPGWMVVR